MSTRRVVAVVIGLFVVFSVGVRIIEAFVGGPTEAQKDAATLFAGVLGDMGAVTEASGSLYLCTDKACEMAGGRRLEEAVERTSVALDTARLEIDDACIDDVALAYVRALHPLRAGALQAQAGDSKAMFSELDRGQELLRAASDLYLTCDAFNLEGETLAAALRMRSSMNSLYAVDEAMYRCIPEDRPVTRAGLTCTRRQGALMEQKAREALTSLDRTLDELPDDGPAVCKTMFQTMREMLTSFERAGSATRRGAWDEAVRVASKTSALSGQYQREAGECAAAAKSSS